MPRRRRGHAEKPPAYVIWHVQPTRRSRPSLKLPLSTPNLRTAAMSLKRGRSPPPPTDSVHRSAPITDRQSVFVAHFSPTLSAKALQAHPDFRTASHRIAAWRKPTAQRSLLGSARVLDAGHDDDGEKYAGKRLARVLDGMGVEGAVCVARWYGGVMLGPVRFEHIENCARQAIRDWRAATTSAADGAKRVKVEGPAEARSKEGLEKVLAERDNSIEVLRGLLADKKRVVGREHGAAVKQPATPKKPMNYKAMPVQALVKLEKARDATIAFILKELDKIEDEILKAMGDEDPDESDKTPVPETADEDRQDEGKAKSMDDDTPKEVEVPGGENSSEHINRSKADGDSQAKMDAG